jgi:hypothetical protein
MNSHLRFVLGSVVGGIALHVAVAACSSNGSSSGTSDAGVVDALATALADVFDSNVARADEETFTQTQVFTEPCDKVYPGGSGSSPTTMAEHEFPGLTTADLTKRLVVYRVSGNKEGEPGLSQYPTALRLDGVQVFIKDGKAGIACKSSESDGRGVFRLLK